MLDANLSVVEQFKNNMRAEGIYITTPIFVTDTFRRAHIAGDKPSKKNFSYWLKDLGDYAYGYGEDHKRNIKVPWHSKKHSDLSPSERKDFEEEIRKSQEQLNAKKEVLWEKTAKYAEKLWSQGSPILPGQTHPYLVKKGLTIEDFLRNGYQEKVIQQLEMEICKLRINTNIDVANGKCLGWLMIPLTNQGKIWSIEFLGPEGEKYFLYQGKKQGNYRILGNPLDIPLEKCNKIGIAEGYASALSAYLAFGHPVISCCDAGNLLNVCSSDFISNLNKIIEITIFGDDDKWPNKEGIINNTGRQKATEAARILNCRIIFPMFEGNTVMDKDGNTILDSDGNFKHPTDIDDLRINKGINEVKKQIELAAKLKKKGSKRNLKNEGKGELQKCLKAEDVLKFLEPRLELFHDKNKNAYASVKDKITNKSGSVSLLIDSDSFRKWILEKCWKNFNKALKKNPLEECISTLEAQACFNGPCYSVYVRIGNDGDITYLDLADNNNHFIKIDKNGWQIVTETTLKFIRFPSMQSLPIPEKNGNFQDLFKFINIPEKYQKLVMGWLLECFRLNTPYPVLVLHGLQGSAKSTTQEFLRELIDPSQPNLRGTPKKREDLMVAAVNNFMVSLNNVSHLSAEQQDDLCCMSTGGAFSTRKLYTTSLEQTHNIKRPVILNGINEVVTAQDLIDRSISIELPTVSEKTRKTESVMKQEFEAVKFKLLGAMLDTLVAVLKELPNVQLDEKPRMADFAMLGVALEKALGWEIGSFIKDYSEIQSETRISALEHCPIAMALIDFVKDADYTGSFQKLHNVLTDKYGTKGLAWPGSAKGLAEALKRQHSALKELGIQIIFDRVRREDGKHVTVKKITDLKNKINFQKQVQHVQHVQ